MTEQPRPVGELSFKEASVELEQIVRALEAGDLELEDSLARYQRGVELLASLRARLADAEQKVQVLVASSEASHVADTTAAPAAAFIQE
jgi:exodeoxyribonuclease VII small subunit